MDFLTRLPVVGPLVARLLRTRAYRVWDHVNGLGGNRLAGAITFFGFLALFPLLTLAMALAAAALSDQQVADIQKKIAEQIPGIADSLDLGALVRNAGTVGLVSGLLLLVSGLGWVDTMRASIRTLWQLDAEPGNPVLRKLLDVGVLVGLGVATAVSLGASALFSALTGQVAEALGLQRSGVGSWLLGLAGFAIAVGADMILFAYLLTAFPRITDQSRRTVLAASLIGAVGFEVLKVLLSSYISGVAGKSMYGAFGVPVALLLWINFVTRLLMYCVGWTALADPEAARRRARERALHAYREAGGEESAPSGAGGAPDLRKESGTPPPGEVRPGPGRGPRPAPGGGASGG
ncbi:YihY/virulence factor BrkB family protein [Streptacidiphilus sp. ASG 303]|uniref:YihY/virulence factor BrkB family protein n=1 Tax=Streptacidiphilus sp. ASG 303 TaxID=2896847 RepID=UPI001E3CF2F1|nr:YihY/virulence factor BrkB family protein [Streptacidiphilus sp. ASG 303]MCD0481874.1 YihY/virulence factor BrkB family protein [Streptacidiphilus sp. ASG 303]